MMKHLFFLFIFIFTITAAEKNNIKNFPTQEEIDKSFELFNFSKCLWSDNLSYFLITEEQAEKIKQNIKEDFQPQLSELQSNLFLKNILIGLKHRDKKYFHL